MLKGNENLLKINFKNEKIIYSETRKIIYEALYELYFFFFFSPMENILFYIICFLLSYLQIIVFIFNETVSN